MSQYNDKSHAQIEDLGYFPRFKPESNKWDAKYYLFLIVLIKLLPDKGIFFPDNMGYFHRFFVSWEFFLL